MQKNSKASQLLTPVHLSESEYKSFVSVKNNENKLQCTDIIFNKNGDIKNILSELPKEKVKELFNQLVDDYYERYRGSE